MFVNKADVAQRLAAVKALAECDASIVSERKLPSEDMRILRSYTNLVKHLLRYCSCIVTA